MRFKTTGYIADKVPSNIHLDRTPCPKQSIVHEITERKMVEKNSFC